MAKQKKPVHKVQMIQGKRDMIRMLLRYRIGTGYPGCLGEDYGEMVRKISEFDEKQEIELGRNQSDY